VTIVVVSRSVLLVLSVPLESSNSSSLAKLLESNVSSISLARPVKYKLLAS
jgi:hypothetical protein